MISEKDILVVIPAFNEEHRIRNVVRGVRQYLPHVRILVVDDGSADGTTVASRETGACVLRHPFNLGVGTALQSGYKFAVQEGYKYVLQLDGDGQHPPIYLPAFVSKLKETEADLINVDVFNAYVKTIVHNEPMVPFSMDLTKDVEAEAQAENPRVAELIRELSRLKFGKEVRSLEASIAERARL